MNYIAELRALVGVRPLILPGTSVLIVDPRGQLLLLRRSDTHDWGLPGGFMEPGESFEDTGRREVREETGLELGAMTLFDVFSGPEYFYKYPHGDQVFNVTAAYIADVPGDAIAVDHVEIGGYAFFDLANLPNDILPPERPIIERYASRVLSSRSPGP